mmetsp:Transcript_83215/g.147017  ORF Transcript_83215/g.147017 Transcript_83215/m.147017 type:complete len:214 (-) Transcript_83215:1654-2295(-)
MELLWKCSCDRKMQSFRSNAEDLPEQENAIAVCWQKPEARKQSRSLALVCLPRLHQSSRPQGHGLQAGRPRLVRYLHMQLHQACHLDRVRISRAQRSLRRHPACYPWQPHQMRQQLAQQSQPFQHLQCLFLLERFSRPTHSHSMVLRNHLGRKNSNSSSKRRNSNSSSPLNCNSHHRHRSHCQRQSLIWQIHRFKRRRVALHPLLKPVQQPVL